MTEVTYIVHLPQLKSNEGNKNVLKFINKPHRISNIEYEHKGHSGTFFFFAKLFFVVFLNSRC
jgi:hypothetical protein